MTEHAKMPRFGDSGAKRCCQCGRVGTRAFRVIPEATHEPTGAVVGPFVVCASAKACRKRWSKPARDIYEEC